MKVLMFGWEFPPYISGGLGTACHGISKGLLACDVDVVFVVPKAQGNEDTGKMKLVSAAAVPMPVRRDTAAGFSGALTFFEVNCPLVPYLSPDQFAKHNPAAFQESQHGEMENETQTTHYTFNGGYGKDLMKEVWQYALVAAEIADTNSFDIIHAHDWLSFPAGIMAKEVSGKPLVVHVHATEFDRAGDSINMQVYETERQGMLQADQIIAVSEFTRQTIIHKYYITPEKVVTIHNAVDNSPRTVMPAVSPFREKVVTFIGRITWQKGPASFIEAAARILKIDKGFRFVMAGNGDLLPAMMKMAARLRISSNIHFTGFLKDQQREQLLAKSHVVVMPSVSEPFGIVPLEAIRAGVPVIVSKQSGVQEILQYALKVDWWNTDALANAIYALAQYKGLSGMLARESGKEVAALRWEKQAQLMKELYESLLNL
ncbi:glycosyltransferase family 4 protein [Chitinophaga polysaccharea]|uniref:glycosyltransferase family 4 protein n=1 Tax=Chitinophaga TaxID=79328 RepID=UPI001455A49D|nr:MULTISPECIES: glycosyltransferase family 4 protein [Chitinophaga]NLR62597.1 glycosyltransferase family 4 protein [Chitinophaga polysaccharea]NLU91469.1 glycosyltransferase family 4 protein [Chitinophaga sp. Ak27]